MAGEYLTIKEAAEALGVSKDTIRRRVKAGKIPAEKRKGPHGGDGSPENEYAIIQCYQEALRKVINL